MDPLSDVFSLLDLQSAASARFEAGGDWALRFPAKPHLKFNAVLRGHCWIALAGESPRRLGAGDTFLLADAPPFVLASSPRTEAADASPYLGFGQPRLIRHGGDDTVLIGSGFVFRDDNARLLLDALPPMIHIPASEPAATALRATLGLLDIELTAEAMGTTLVTRRLADVLLVQALRAYAALDKADDLGWIGALGDGQIGAALRLMHGDVERGWTVAELAAAVGMSRSGFALRFRRRTGRAPLDYLTRWRMQLAREALRRGDQTIATLASRFGYASESAFGNAFKRVFGRAPKRYWPASATSTGFSR